MIVNRERCTLWNSQECDKHECISVGTPYTVVNISYAHVEGVVLILPRSDRHRCLVTPENNRHEHRAMCFRFLRNLILRSHNQISTLMETTRAVIHTACPHAQEPDIKSHHICFLSAPNFRKGAKSNSFAKLGFARMFFVIRCGSRNQMLNLSFIQGGTLSSGRGPS